MEVSLDRIGEHGSDRGEAEVVPQDDVTDTLDSMQIITFAYVA